MRIDRYTKVVLTIIAACLFWLSLGGPGLLPAAHAQSTTTHVLIAGWVDDKGKVHSVSTPTEGIMGLPVAVVYSTR
jgi:hypothetical protein